MHSITPRQLALLSATAIVAIASAQQARAESPATEPPPTIVAAPSPDRIPLLTGSRLPDSDGISVSPIFVVDREEFDLSGTFNPEVLLNDLPQFIPGLTAFVNNGGDGTARLNLRGLDSADTLVLVNGRRWIPADTGEGADINSIPAFLIDNVQVTTGGASAVYGSGAIAGVVNFQLRKIDGLEAGARGAITEQGDGRRAEAHVAYGTSFGGGRGHVGVYGDYLDRRPIFQGDRGFSSATLFDGLNGQFIQTGSTAVPQGAFEAFFGGEGTNFDSLAIFAAPGVSRPFNFPTDGGLGDLYNFAPVNYLMVPQERWIAGGNVDYEFSPSARAYGELTYIDDKTAEQLAPANIFAAFDYGLPRIDINAVAQYLSPADLAQFEQISMQQFDPGFVSIDFRYRTVQVGPRRIAQDRQAWHALAGVTGSLGALTYDLSYSYGQTDTPYHETGEVNGGVFVSLVENGTCNVFGANLLSAGCIAAISQPLTNRETIHQHIVNATLSGPAFMLPGTGNPLSFVAGAEWRSVHGDFTVDPNTYLTTASQPAPVNGGYDVEEAFGQLKAPLVDKGWLYRLELDGGARFSHYSLASIDSIWSWFAGGEVAPISDFTLRVQYQSAFRAPNLAELFKQDMPSYPFALDPCSGWNFEAPDSLRDLCVATGVPADQVFNFYPSPQAPTIVGGNPSLRAERSDSWTFGAVFRPKVAPRLTLSVDYYHIDVRNAVGFMPAGFILDGCYSPGGTADNPLCQLISRDPATGEITEIDGRLVNVGSKTSSGIDLVFDYSQPIRGGIFSRGHSTLALQMVGGWLDRASMTPLPSFEVDCTGKFGSNCGDPRPRWSWVDRLSWVDGPVTSSIRWRHTGAVTDDDPYIDHVVERIGAYDLVDLGFAVRVARRYDVHFGINNLFDRKPPVLGSNAAFSGSNTYPGTYDVLGRDYFLSLDVAI